MERYHLKTDNQQSSTGNKFRVKDYFFSLYRSLAVVYYIFAYSDGRSRIIFEMHS